MRWFIAGVLIVEGLALFVRNRRRWSEPRPFSEYADWGQLDLEALGAVLYLRVCLGDALHTWAAKLPGIMEEARLAESSDAFTVLFIRRLRLKISEGV